MLFVKRHPPKRHMSKANKKIVIFFFFLFYCTERDLALISQNFKLQEPTWVQVDIPIVFCFATSSTETQCLILKKEKKCGFQGC